MDWDNNGHECIMVLWTAAICSCRFSAACCGRSYLLWSLSDHRALMLLYVWRNAGDSGGGREARDREKRGFVNRMVRIETGTLLIGENHKNDIGLQSSSRTTHGALISHLVCALEVSSLLAELLNLERSNSKG